MPRKRFTNEQIAFALRPPKRWCQPPSFAPVEPQIRELQRLLGKKTLETEILREAMERVAASKRCPRA